jgi:hypothetical protein
MAMRSGRSAKSFFSMSVCATPRLIWHGYQEVADLRDRVSRLEGMLAAGLALSREAGPRRDDAGCRELPIRRAEFSLVSIRRVRNGGAAANAPEV